MPGLNLNFGVSAFVNGAIQVAIILIGGVIVSFLIRIIIPKLIKQRIPKLRRETKEQLAARSQTLSHIIVQVLTVLLWVFVLVMILSQLGVDIAPLIAGIGVAGLALGFAAQNIVRDYLHGFFIIMEDWYREGEVAVIQGTGGLVEKITLRRTILRDLNGTMHIFPNS